VPVVDWARVANVLIELGLGAALGPTWTPGRGFSASSIGWEDEHVRVAVASHDATFVGRALASLRLAGTRFTMELLYGLPARPALETATSQGCIAGGSPRHQDPEPRDSA
jgi:hypothetical protein